MSINTTPVATGAMPATATAVLPHTTGTTVPAMSGMMMATPQVLPGTTNVVEHQPIVAREVVVEHPVEIRREHHVQPIIHEREVQVQPIIRTHVTTEMKVTETERDIMLPPIVEQPQVVSTPRQVLPNAGVPVAAATTATTTVPATTTTTTTGTGVGARHATLGQKIKGTIKGVQGALTHNPAKKEEGRLLRQGIEPTRHTMA